MSFSAIIVYHRRQSCKAYADLGKIGCFLLIIGGKERGGRQNFVRLCDIFACHASQDFRHGKYLIDE